ncbi:MAG TPA: hypothetical protein VMT00_07425 [Thermoanaerobaculia bacterium]|nr:hypothetical protein [Thermoanaerobaculia bacterium]
MSGTLLRFGLWIILAVLAMYVLSETYENSPLREFVTPVLMQRAGGLGLALVGIGAVVSLFERAARKLNRSFCKTCGRAIPPRTLYCRQHIRSIIEDEHDRTHSTRIRRA